MAYADLLKDPRWQKKRLEVMERAGFKCELCGNGERELNIHHKRYRAGAKPWEYELPELLCICHDCHQKLHGITPEPISFETQVRGISIRDEALLILMLVRPEDASFLEASDFDDPTVYETKGVSDKYAPPKTCPLTDKDVERVRKAISRERDHKKRRAQIMSIVQSEA